MTDTNTKVISENAIANALANSDMWQTLLPTLPSRMITDTFNRLLAEKVGEYVRLGYKITIGK